MRFGRKGQGWGLILGLVIVTIIMAAGFYLWQGASTGVWPTSPEAYIKMWKDFADAAFKTEDQPWRMVGLFVFPFLIYFTLIFFALNVAIVGIQQRVYYAYRNIERPLVVLCFAIAFMQLPFPFTYSLYGWFASLSPILIIMAWVLPIVGIALIFYTLRGLGLGGAPTPPTIPPTIPPTPPAIPTPLGGPGAAPGLPAPVNQAINNMIIILKNNTNRIRNLIA
ncbi:MAG: hypothetical protein QMD36_01060 [Candidatus Aenigmarchaeota archaeon]|nr:hypothetical protein [Candidatus Aenigmarchaeota archaeon]